MRARAAAVILSLAGQDLVGRTPIIALVMDCSPGVVAKEAHTW